MHLANLSLIEMFGKKTEFLINSPNIQRGFKFTQLNFKYTLNRFFVCVYVE